MRAIVRTTDTSTRTVPCYVHWTCIPRLQLVVEQLFSTNSLATFKKRHAQFALFNQKQVISPVSQICVLVQGHYSLPLRQMDQQSVSVTTLRNAMGSFASRLSQFLIQTIGFENRTKGSLPSLENSSSTRLIHWCCLLSIDQEDG